MEDRPCLARAHRLLSGLTVSPVTYEWAGGEGGRREEGGGEGWGRRLKCRSLSACYDGEDASVALQAALRAFGQGAFGPSDLRAFGPSDLAERAPAISFFEVFCHELPRWVGEEFLTNAVAFVHHAVIADNDAARRFQDTVFLIRREFAPVQEHHIKKALLHILCSLHILNVDDVPSGVEAWKLSL
jgi:hypothetical protein